MADIDLDYKGAEQAISDMLAASQKIDSQLADLMQQLQPFASQFVGQASEAYQDFQRKVNSLEDAMKQSLHQGAQILDSMMHGHRESDQLAANNF
jgi:WXG100 family type VII secretion target